MPEISIIVPVYNAHKYLGQTLDSVVAQTLTDWELIAVDDGSQDDSAAIVKRYAAQDARIRLVQQPNGGVAAARNQGFAESNPRSAYVIFLDNDDLWERDTLQILRDALQAHPEYAAAHGQARYIDSDSNLYTREQVQQQYASLDQMLNRRWTFENGRVVQTPSTQETTFATLVVENCIVSPGLVLLRRSDLAFGPLFDSKTAPCDDLDLYLRLTRRKPLRYVPEAILNYRLHGANASNNKDLMANAVYYAINKALASPDNTPQQRRIVETSLRHHKADDIGLRMQWMRECLRKGQIIAAIKQGRQAFQIRHSLHQRIAAAMRQEY